MDAIGRLLILSLAAYGGYTIYAELEKLRVAARAGGNK